MAIILQKNIDGLAIWALWHIVEDEATLTQLCQPDSEMLLLLAEIKHPVKRCEFLASRTLLRQLLAQRGHDLDGIYKDENGKPFLRNCQCTFSLSHSAEYVAVIIANSPVGIDIEPIKPKIMRIAPRFLAISELPDATTSEQKATLYWCAKEAIYKLFNRENASLRDHIRIRPFELTQTIGTLSGTMQMPSFSGKARIHSLVYEQYGIAIALES